MRGLINAVVGLPTVHSTDILCNLGQLVAEVSHQSGTSCHLCYAQKYHVECIVEKASSSKVYQQNTGKNMPPLHSLSSVGLTTNESENETRQVQEIE